MDQTRMMMKEDKEIWITHTNGIYKGYSVSSHGNIVSHYRDTHIGGKYSWVLDYSYSRHMNPYSDVYKAVTVNKLRRRVHRIVCQTFWGFHDGDVDHIDGDKMNNCVWNLRWCTRSQNAQNTERRLNNTSGCVGVSYNTRDKLWVASWHVNGIHKNRSFKHKDDAIEFRKKMVVEHYDANFYKSS